ncbi:MAG: hypothetical protein J6K85_04225 [Clostridia bacterium]|nr:hypothetical protein [Clostridia bacterium]
MALRWDWDKKIGELLIKQDDKEFNIDVYQGNALAIFINEWTDKDGVEKYSMYNFFCDKEHFKNCTKDKTWNYAAEWVKLTLWEVPSDLWVLLKDLAKRGVNIEIRRKDDA